MSKIEWKLRFSLFAIFMLLFGSSIFANTTNLDYTSIAVNSGDTFTYELVKSNVSPENSFSGRIYIDFGDDAELELLVGDQFVMTIVNASIGTSGNADEFRYIESKFTSIDTNFTLYHFVDTYGSWILLTDWENLIPHIEEKAQIASNEAKEQGIESSLKSRETDNLILFVYETTLTYPDYTRITYQERIYNKTTGVLAYERVLVKISENNDRFEWEFVIKLIDFDKPDESEDGFLDGLQTSFTLISLIFISAIIYKKRNSFL